MQTKPQTFDYSDLYRDLPYGDRMTVIARLVQGWMFAESFGFSLA